MKFHVRNAVAAVVIYLLLLSFLLGISVGVTIIVAIYCIVCMIITRNFISSAESRSAGAGVEFSQSGALASIGSEWGSFHYVFYSEKDVSASLLGALNESLKTKFGCAELKQIVFKDVDRELPTPESRTFLRTDAAQTARKTGFVLLCALTRTSNIQGVRWWILLSGLRDPNKVFWRYVLSPMGVPFQILPYLRREFDPLHGLKSVYPGFFNAVDILNSTRELQYVAFETLVEVLDSLGIDTSDLKQQRGNILNINVTGGQTNFGSVIQGAVNRINTAVGTAKK
ncbi:MAG TPA: hypothetical protein VNV61_16830 [Steroidobacteraceae bacterium]|jgi:hypothetical protein|nr:hypothetical protein [Steroidobacteraceae bacterium]